TRWYDRFLKGLPNGVDKEKPVQVAPEPWNDKPASFAGPPKVTGLTFASSGLGAMTAHGKIVRTFRPLKRTTEQFGSPIIRVPEDSRLTVGKVTLTLPVLPKTISR